MGGTRNGGVWWAACGILCGILLWGHGVAGVAAPVAGKAGKQEVFARVGGTVITRQEYDNTFRVAIRNTFYHPNPSPAKLAALQRRVGDELVNNELLVQEAKRRGLKPDPAKVKKGIAAFDKRYAGNPVWRKKRAQFLAQLTLALEHQSLREQLQRQVREVPPPTAEQVKAYYRSHPKLFTEPSQVKVSLILLKVDPSAPNATRKKAMKEAQAIIKRLHQGADFATEAKLHSGDFTATKGGDMGYLHQGMLGKWAEAAIAKLKPGEISPPVSLLEGVAIFRLEKRRSARLDSFAVSRKRARDLWRREERKLDWTRLIAKLRKQTPIQMNTSFYRPLGGEGHGKDGAR